MYQIWHIRLLFSFANIMGYGDRRVLYECGIKKQKTSKIFGNVVEKHYLCIRLLKLRHSFLNGYGRLRTAFLLQFYNYDATSDILYRWLQLLLWFATY